MKALIHRVSRVLTKYQSQKAAGDSSLNMDIKGLVGKINCPFWRRNIKQLLSGERTKISPWADPKSTIMVSIGIRLIRTIRQEPFVSCIMYYSSHYVCIWIRLCMILEVFVDKPSVIVRAGLLWKWTCTHFWLIKEAYFFLALEHFPGLIIWLQKIKW